MILNCIKLLIIALIAINSNAQETEEKGVFLETEEPIPVKEEKPEPEIAANSTESGKNSTQKFVQCLPNMGGTEVNIVNDTELMKFLTPDGNITSRDIPATCVLVLFYSKYCTFSSMAAPHFNALARAFPDIKLAAINAMMYHLFNTQNGIVGIPSLLLFHNGRPVAKFNYSEYTLENFSRFLGKHTGILAMQKSTVTSGDFAGPVTSSPSKDTDFCLVLAWLFVLSCAAYYFSKSNLCNSIVEIIKSNWRESEVQHEHIE